MARSQVIKDVANVAVSLEITLTRLKIILSAFNKPELTIWVENELSGYPDDSMFPQYRLFSSNGAYATLDGVELGMYFTNKKISLDSLFKDKNVKSGIPTSIRGLEKVSENSNFVRHIPTHMVEELIQGMVHVTGAYVDYGRMEDIANSVLSAVKQRALDILLLLEKEFGELDAYDIPIDAKSPSEVNEISDKIIKIMGVNGMSVTVNNNGGTAQNNFADGNSVINASQHNIVNTEQLNDLINAVRSNMGGSLSEEEKEVVNSSLEVIESEMATTTPRKSFLKTALSSLQAIKEPAEFLASVAALAQFVMSL